MSEPFSRGRVSPDVALAILRSLQAVDTPREVLEDESFRHSLPRRLGLSDVVAAQMRRYEEMARRRRGVPAEEYVDLVRLVARRPDAEEVLAAAGTALAEERVLEPGALRRTGRRLVPIRLRRRRLVRTMARMARLVDPVGRLSSGTTPISVALDPALLSRTGDGGLGCELLTAALRVCVGRSGLEDLAVRHVTCAADGGTRCEWIASQDASEA
jgi:hypothetical protein